jgi:hypothetical protein
VKREKEKYYKYLGYKIYLKHQFLDHHRTKLKKNYKGSLGIFDVFIDTIMRFFFCILESEIFQNKKQLSPG